MLALLSSIFSLLSAFSSIVLAVSLRIIYVPVSSALALSVSAVETTRFSATGAVGDAGALAVLL